MTALLHFSDNKKSFLLFLSLFLILFFCSFIVTQKWLDTDFGWHLRTGQLILERGVPYVDWYSYTMPLFPWIDHEWLTQVAMYKLYSVIGLHFLLLIFLFLYALSFFIVKSSRQSFLDVGLPIFLGYWATISFLGIRPQLLTVLLIAIVWKVLNKFLDDNSKLIYFLPILFVIWVNLHAGFSAGLFILFVTLGFELFKKTNIIQKIKHLNFLDIKKQSGSNIARLTAILIASFLATLVNPYGLRIYGEIFSVIGDNFYDLTL